jgi:vacuolar-type H+-ATPase subunit F/Vma7
MSAVAAIGAPSRVAGFALAGALVFPANDDAQAVAAWQGLPGTVAVVVLTEAAAAALAAAGAFSPGAPLTVVLS